jgi:hypothetical protein
LTLKDRIAVSRASKQCQQNTFDDDGTWNALFNNAERLAKEESRRALWFIWSNWPRQQRTIENKTTGPQTIITPSVADAASALFLGEANPPVRTEQELIAFITAELLLDEAFLVEAVGPDWKIDVVVWSDNLDSPDEHALVKAGHYTVGVKFVSSTVGASTIEYRVNNLKVSKVGIDRFPSVAIVRAVMGDNWSKVVASLPKDSIIFSAKRSVIAFTRSRTAVLPLALRVANPIPRTEGELDTEDKGLSQNIRTIHFLYCPGIQEHHGAALAQRDAAIAFRMPGGIHGTFAWNVETAEEYKVHMARLAERRKPHPGAKLALTVAPTARLREGRTVAPLRIRVRRGAGTGTGTVVVPGPSSFPTVGGWTNGSFHKARGGNLVKKYVTKK